MDGGLPGHDREVLDVSYDFADNWGTVTRGKFEALALGTLAFVRLFAIVGYVLGAPVRSRQADVELDVELEPAPQPAV